MKCFEGKAVETQQIEAMLDLASVVLQPGSPAEPCSSMAGAEQGLGLAAQQPKSGAGHAAAG